MPEMRFRIRWSDGAEERCYSPSLVIRDHFAVGETYEIADFAARSRAALLLASDRVREKYGFACARALGQLARIEEVCARFAGEAKARVRVEAFED